MPNHYQSDEDKAREEVENFIASYKNTEIEYYYAVVKDNILIGHVGIGETDIDDGVSIYEVCCAINKNYRGFGYAAEATKAFVIWCKNTFGLAQIYASTDRENIASNKTLLNAGFTLTNIKIKELKVYIFN